jgi:hypothetical protein
MSRPRIELDFARGPRRFSRRGAALLALGLVGAALVLAQYQGDLTQRSVLEAQLADINAARIAPTPDMAADRVASESRTALAELTMPWSRLLQELERASAEGDGRVAVLGVEPDREKHQLRIIAEARTLPIALAYVQRLQVSDALRYPMLESHEVQTRDPEKPVRFQIRAEWRAP